MTSTSKEALEVTILDRVLYLYYPIWFKKDEIKALIGLGNEVNAMT